MHRIGIDIGSTYTVSAYQPDDGSMPCMIPARTSSRSGEMLPSLMAVLETGEIVIGLDAEKLRGKKRLLDFAPVKRFMGKSSNEAKKILQYTPFPVNFEHVDAIEFHIGNKSWSPPEIAAFYIGRMKERAETLFNHEVTEVTLAIPAFFKEEQTSAMIQSARLVGFQDIKTILNPMAICATYDLLKKDREKVIVFDFGGGSFEVSILEVGKGKCEIIETVGDPYLGGRDLDRMVANMLQDAFCDSGAINVSDWQVRQMVMQEADAAKRALSYRGSYDFHFLDKSRKIAYDHAFSIFEFAQLTRPILDKVIEYTRLVLEKARLSTSDLDEIILSGGVTRMHYIQEQVESFFQKTPLVQKNPDELVALGAATVK